MPIPWTVAHSEQTTTSQTHTPNSQEIQGYKLTNNNQVQHLGIRPLILLLLPQRRPLPLRQPLDPLPLPLAPRNLRPEPEHPPVLGPGDPVLPAEDVSQPGEVGRGETREGARELALGGEGAAVRAVGLFGVHRLRMSVLVHKLGRNGYVVVGRVMAKEVKASLDGGKKELPTMAQRSDQCLYTPAPPSRTTPRVIVNLLPVKLWGPLETCILSQSGRIIMSWLFS